MVDPYPGLREWAAAHAEVGHVRAKQVLELLEEADRLRTAPKPVQLPPCKIPGHPADCDCRWAATGEGGY